MRKIAIVMAVLTATTAGASAGDTGLIALMTDGDPTDSPLLTMDSGTERRSDAGSPPACIPDEDTPDACWVIIGYNYSDEGKEAVYYDLTNGPVIVPEGYTDEPVWPETPREEIPFEPSRDGEEEGEE